MNYQSRRAMMMGLHVAVTAMIGGAGACLPPLSGVTCGDTWCPDGELCVSVIRDVGVQESCAAQNQCGNGVRESAEQCDCGSDGIIAEDPACGGQGNSDTGGLCRLDCIPHCGDGVVDPDEVCDTDLPVSTTSCADLNYDFGVPACSESCHAITAKSCGSWNWQPMNSGVSQDLTGIWGVDGNDVFAVGADGQIVHYDGVQWRSMGSGAEPLLGVWGSGRDDVYAVGYGAIKHYDGNHWSSIASQIPVGVPYMKGIWGSGPRNVFVAGQFGGMLKYDGQSWTFDLLGQFVTGIWGSGPSDVFAVGYSRTPNVTGQISHYNGHQWSPVTWSDPVKVLKGVWGSGPDDVFAVGDEGTVLHLKDGVWQSMPRATQENLLSVWGTGPANVFAAGESGVVLHYDGNDQNLWQSMNSARAATLSAVWGDPAGDVFIVGERGTILRPAHSSWGQMMLDGAPAVTGVWGSGPRDIYATGDGILDGFPGRDGSFPGHTSRILHYDGDRWTSTAPDLDVVLWKIWGSAPGGRCPDPGIFAVGSTGAEPFRLGVVLHHDGQSWNSDVLPQAPLLSSVWGSSCDDVFAVGQHGTVLHYDGDRWRSQTTPVTRWLTGVWGSGPGDVYAVGSFSQPSDPDPSDPDPGAGAGVADAGIILHYDGQQWKACAESICSNGLPNLVDVWGSDASHVFAVGYGGAVMRYDGQGWYSMESGTSANLFGVGGTSADDVYAVGEGGTLLHYDGQSWQPMRSGTSASFYGIWGDRASGTVIVGGAKGPFVNDGVVYRMTHPARDGRSGPSSP